METSRETVFETPNESSLEVATPEVSEFEGAFEVQASEDSLFGDADFEAEFF